MLPIPTNLKDILKRGTDVVANNKKWIIPIIIVAVVICAVYLVRYYYLMSELANRTNLELDIVNIEKIEEIGRFADGTTVSRSIEKLSWVEFFNSLELTYHKDGWVMYNRPGTHFLIYYTDGTTDTIRFHYGHLIYNGDFYDIVNHEGKTEIHDKLRAK